MTGTHPADLTPYPFQDKPLLPRKILLLGGGVVALFGLVIGAYLLACVLFGQFSPVYLVNGTGIPYDVTIAHHSVTLPPFGSEKIAIGQGERTVEITSGPWAGRQFNVDIRSPLLLRPFQSPTFVLNPDRTAVLLWEQIKYYPLNVTIPDDDPNARFEFHLGKKLHQFNGLDFPFQDFPDQLPISDNGPNLRQRIELLKDNDAEFRALIDLMDAPAEDRESYYRAALDFAPNNATYISGLANALDFDEFIEFARPRLAERPARMAYHIEYQDLVAMSDSPIDLEQEYRDILADEGKDDPAWTYLLSRVVAEPDESSRLLAEAAAHPQATRPPIKARMYEAISAGEFQSSLECAERLLKSEPGDINLLEAQFESLLGLRRYADALVVNHALRQQEPEDASAIELGLGLLAKLGRSESSEATSLISDYCNHLTAEGYDARGIAETRAWLNASLHYAASEHRAAASDFRNYRSYYADFIADLLDGRLESAEAILETDEQGDYYDYIWLALAAIQSGDEALADRSITTAAGLLIDWGDDAEPLGRWLMESSPSDPASIARSGEEAQVKAAILAVMSARHPDIQEDCRRLARHFNYWPRFPSHLIDQITVAPQN